MPEARPKPDIQEFSFLDLKGYLSRKKVPVFRAKQIFDWIYKKGVDSFDQMANLPGALREVLRNDFSFLWASVKQKKISKDGTVKFLFEVGHGQFIETVFIPTQSRGTICVSTQVGCKFGCAFCASGLKVGCGNNMCRDPP